MNNVNDPPTPIDAEHPPGVNGSVIDTILHRVMASLTHFLASGTTAAIDLRAVPRMNPATYQFLKETLSIGEVTATVAAEVKVELSETQYPGVWWVTHRNERGGIVTELIEITEVPEILKSHVADMRAGLQRLTSALAVSTPQADRAAA